MRAYEGMSSFHDSTTPIASAIRIGLDAVHDAHCVEDGDSSPPVPSVKAKFDYAFA